MAVTTESAPPAPAGPDLPPTWFSRVTGGRRWAAPASVGAVLALGVAYTAWQDPNADGVFLQCPSQELLGVDCPGCGGLRAVHAFTRGDLAAAADHNVVLALAMPALAVGWLLWMLHGLGASVPRLPRVPRPVWVALGVLVVAFSVVRNIEGVALFEYLASTA